MNILAIEIKSNIKSLTIWCIGMVAMIGAGMGKFVGYTKSGEAINDILTIFPKSLLNVMGISSFDLSTVIGFYGVLFLYLILIAASHAIMLGVNIILKEENDKTIEFLLAKPVSRSKVITSKLLAALFNIIILNIVTLTASFFAVNYFNQFHETLIYIIMLMAGMFILQLIFLSVGLLLASASNNPKTTTSKAGAILLTTFILYLLINMSDKLEKLKFLTPFKYFEAESIILGKGFDMFFIILSFVIIVISLIGTYKFYKRRDLNV
ncbi:ABC transporter permease subunit [Maledivibacter halophilus]|uniref:ABC-2 type transport system permease protein n=1 Tax=Maledivibacter halophilus TaxID=36842 RepID=A0A1T5IBV1_9FIRM|nr:ABC transporter permease subunit [Maledivibacter halophilus]SKC36528.1 ABC-2 type transport system permease protein [Maledivibacter halophilus]